MELFERSATRGGAQSWHLRLLWDVLKKWCRNFENFDFWPISGGANSKKFQKIEKKI